MNKDNQGACQSRKTAKKCANGSLMADFPNQELVAIPKPWVANIRLPRRVEPRPFNVKELGQMPGKLAGAFLGEKIAGPNQGAKGAILGYGAADLARRCVPAWAALLVGGRVFRKWR